MNEKDLSKMAIMDQSVFQNTKNGKLVIDKDYNLNKAKIVVPKGMTIDLSGGTINNGSIIFDDTLLEGVGKHDINAYVEGTISNEEVRMSWFSDVNQVKVKFANQRVLFDETIVINTTQIVGNGVTYDGSNNNFICNVTFFSIQGQSNVTIQNFNAVANASNIDFVEMPTTAAFSTGIDINHNIINGFKVGISLNCENSDYWVSNCSVTYNQILNAAGSTAGHGYGIHLANVKDSIISNNIITNSGRHSIYHAYGSNNQILDNVITNHAMSDNTGYTNAAIEVVRHSTDVLIQGNTITNCYKVGILVYAYPHSHEQDAVNVEGKYGCCENITIQYNYFNITNSSINHTFPSILLGYLYNGSSTPYADFVNYHVNCVKVLYNSFTRLSTENLNCIRVDQCRHPKIEGNSFSFKPKTTGNTRTIIEIRNTFKNVQALSMTALISSNLFSEQGVTSNYTIYCVGELNSLNNTCYDITVSGNSFMNQYNGSNLNYRTYNPVGITSYAASNLHLQAEAL